MKIYSIFPSISGEVDLYHQGRLTTFIRFSGCNCRCSYCDTKYALDINSGTEMTPAEVMEKVKTIGIRKITITGGEPLLQQDALFELTRLLWKDAYEISIETNGSFPLYGYGVGSWVVDWKLPSSGESHKMNIDIFEGLKSTDFIKFVIQDREDFNEAIAIKKILQSKESYQAKFAFSPMHGVMDANTLINWLMREEAYDAILNVQLHKVLNLVEEK